MCGISGIFSPDRRLAATSAADCERMNAAMLHRGPDQGGFFEDEGAVLGHRRLSIIDLSSGSQPMHSHCGRYVLVFNGEIYNFDTLRSELTALGHTFRTRSDTEVILEGYKAWGRGVLDRLRGMFAFALLDRRDRTLFGARDPLGKKPLYYRHSGGTLWFASEMQALKAGLPERPALSDEAIALYFSLGYVPAPLTVYQGIRKLEAGHAFLLSPAGWEEWRYWDVPLEVRSGMGEEEALDHLGGLLDGAVSRRLVSEVPLGAFLSGGIDSNLVVSAMARGGGGPVKTFTAGFGERTALAGVRDERELAAAASAHYGTSHEEFRLSPSGEDLLSDIIPFLGEPLADPSIIPTYLVCREARKRVTVVLTGDGGDEPFGGYSFRYLPRLMEERVRGLLPGSLLSPLLSAASSLAGLAPLAGLRRLRTPLRNLAAGRAESFYLDQSLLPGNAGDVLGDSLLPARHAARDLVAALYAKAEGRDELTRMLYVDTKLYMCEDVLAKADRMSMANSIELRSPLLDQDIVSFAFSLPPELKIKGSECKRLLRGLARSRVAPGLVDQPKTGFSFPLENYLRTHWRPAFEKAVLGGNSIVGRYLRMPAVGARWKRFLAGDQGSTGFLWAVFVFALWAERHEN